MAEASDGDTVQCRRGTLRVWSPVRGVVVHEFKGYLEPDSARLLIDRLERLMGTRNAIDAFNDWEGISGYDTEARVLLTEWVRRTRPRFRSIHVLVRSRLVGMGISVANLALGGMLTAHHERRSFDRAVSDATTREAARSE